MQGKRIKLIYFSMGGSELKQISIEWKRLVLGISIGIAVVVCIVFGILKIFTGTFDNLQVKRLSESKAQLETLLTDMNKKLKTIEGKVEILEKQDNDLRIFVDLPQINDDIRKLGVGGLAENTFSSYSLADTDIKIRANKIQQLVDNIDQRLEYASQSQVAILQKYQEDLKQLKHTPSVKPLNGGRLTAGYGFRRDPFTEKRKHHDGVDISAPRGTDIYSSADGVVVEVESRYSPNNGFGKQVVIDHGYGIKTRYAHLSKIMVNKGDRINRYTLIGKVGDTGRSTGPHLHYEVIVDSNPVNPLMYFMD